MACAWPAICMGKHTHLEGGWHVHGRLHACVALLPRLVLLAWLGMHDCLYFPLSPLPTP